jgi:hypothetical protein
MDGSDGDISAGCGGTATEEFLSLSKEFDDEKEDDGDDDNEY